jgi:outer membrane protein assembly factor BamB
MVVLSDTDKFVYGLDRKTGSLVWKTQLPGYVDSSPAIAGDKVRFQMILCCDKCWLVGWLVGCF